LLRQILRNIAVSKKVYFEDATVLSHVNSPWLVGHRWNHCCPLVPIHDCRAFWPEPASLVSLKETQ